MRLFCDMDGVLADFDAGYERVTGTKLTPRDYRAEWTDVEWGDLRATAPNFFRDLPPMRDAHDLWAYIARHSPTILTGVPMEVSTSGNQKVEWVSLQPWLGPQVPIICCRSREKFHHCRPGDVLIDDWGKHQKLWERAGGIWVTHVAASTTIATLREMGL